MSLFAPTVYNEPSFSGLFRLLDDFDNYRAAATGSPNQQGVGQLTTGRHATHLPTFNPKFDLKETDTAFELHGDLPGIEKDQVQIEFADEHTITIRGRVEREFTNKSDDSKGSSGEEKAEGANDAAKSSSSATENNSKQVSTTGSNNNSVAAANAAPKARYWISERSVGEFSRSFRLGGTHSGSNGVELDHDGVKAKLDNGVLSVTVPKIVRDKSKSKRRIAIN